MYPQFNDLKYLAMFTIQVDFKFYLDNGFINQDEFNKLTEINNEATGKGGVQGAN